MNDGAVAAVSMAQDPVSACVEEFRARNDGVFGDVEGDYYSVLHGESNTSQASPRMTLQRMCQP